MSHVTYMWRSIGDTHVCRRHELCLLYVKEESCPPYVKEESCPTYVKEESCPPHVKEESCPSYVKEESCPPYVKEEWKRDSVHVCGGVMSHVTYIWRRHIHKSTKGIKGRI